MHCLQACNPQAFFAGKITVQNTYQGPVFCNPFGTNGGGNSTNGLVAKLSYIPGNSNSVSDTKNLFFSLFDSAATTQVSPDLVQEQTQIILNQLAIPDLDFNEGFTDEAGNTLNDNAGNKLIQFFALKIQTNLMLNANDTEADYQLAILSDDGSLLDLDLNGDGNYQNWINNDYSHSNRMGCAPTTLHLVPNKPISIIVNWFQGPPTRLALSLFWKTIAPGDSLGDSIECQSAPNSSEDAQNTSRQNDYFFTQNGTINPTPSTKYTDFLSRGWSLIPVSNFYLPKGVKNPCP